MTKKLLTLIIDIFLYEQINSFVIISRNNHKDNDLSPI